MSERNSLLDDFRSLSNRMNNNAGCHLHGSAVIVIGMSTIFLNSLFEHLATQGAHVAVAHDISDIESPLVPPYTLVVFEAMADKHRDLSKTVDQLHSKLVNPKILLIGDVDTLPFDGFVAPAGVAGILSHQATALQVCGALSLINSGLYVIPSTLLGTTELKPLAEPTGGVMSAMLSPRENDVLAGLCQGESNKQIARRLQMAEPTVRAHVRSILVKLGASNRTQASILAIRQGFGAAPGELPCQSARGPESSGAN